MPKYHEKAVQEAISKYLDSQKRNKEPISQVEICHQYGWSRAFFQKRLAKAKLGEEVVNRREYLQRLSEGEEKVLVEWIIKMDSSGHSPSFQRVKAMAEDIMRNRSPSAERRESGETLGAGWIQRFISRHEEIKGYLARPLEASRAESTTKQVLREYFAELHRIKTEFKIHERNIWNMDEQGISLGDNAIKGKVVGKSGRKVTNVSTPDSTERATIIECISALGESIEPLVIFRGNDVQTTWIPARGENNWRLATSEKAWTSNNLAVEWLTEQFVPQSSGRGNPARLLIADGHGSHVTPEFILACERNNIHLVILPPHTTHVLQPLDVGCFSGVKAMYRALVSELGYLTRDAPVRKSTFLDKYALARKCRMTEANICAAWSTAGIMPWNPEKCIQSSRLAEGSDPQAETADAIPLPSSRQLVNAVTTPADAYQAAKELVSRDAPQNNWLSLVSTTSRRWEAEVASLRAELTICKKQREDALEVAEAFRPQKRRFLRAPEGQSSQTYQTLAMRKAEYEERDAREEEKRRERETRKRARDEARQGTNLTLGPQPDAGL